MISDSIYSFWRWNNPQDLSLDKVKDIVEHALSLGINAFEVSPNYGGGKVEDFRSGRWWWEDASKIECGLHANEYFSLSTGLLRE